MNDPAGLVSTSVFDIREAYPFSVPLTLRQVFDSGLPVFDVSPFAMDRFSSRGWNSGATSNLFLPLIYGVFLVFSWCPEQEDAMFFRTKTSGSRTYLQVVENRWEGGRSRQRVVATLGRLDELQRSGQLNSMLCSSPVPAWPSRF